MLTAVTAWVALVTLLRTAQALATVRMAIGGARMRAAYTRKGLPSHPQASCFGPHELRFLAGLASRLSRGDRQQQRLHRPQQGVDLVK